MKFFVKTVFYSLKNPADIPFTFNFLDWNTNPVIISVETPDYPIENIPFPTITICRKDNSPNKFILMENILNDVKFPCFLDE